MTSTRIEVEQAIACGHTHTWITTHLRVDRAYVLRVVDRMDSLASHVDRTDKQARDDARREAQLDAKHALHGTHAGHERHRRRSELPCKLCRAGESTYQNERYLRRKAARNEAA